jgi:hypothetical protein
MDSNIWYVSHVKAEIIILMDPIITQNKGSLTVRISLNLLTEALIR